MSSNIDWSKMNTAEMKSAHAAVVLLTSAQAETARLRKIADDSIAPLQDAIDIEEATADEAARLKLWKKYRIALNRLPEQVGYPTDIDWPALPA